MKTKFQIKRGFLLICTQCLCQRAAFPAGHQLGLGIGWQRPVDVNAVAKNGLTPLHIVVRSQVIKFHEQADEERDRGAAELPGRGLPHSAVRVVQGPDRLDNRRVRVLSGGPDRPALLPARRQPDHSAAEERRLRLLLLQGDQLFRHRQLQHHAAARDRAGQVREA